MLQVELTEAGEAAVDEIIPFIFEYINMLGQVRHCHHHRRRPCYMIVAQQLHDRYTATTPPLHSTAIVTPPSHARRSRRRGGFTTSAPGCRRWPSVSKTSKSR